MDERQNRWFIWGCWFILVSCSAVLIAAVVIAPDDRGFGTHKKLGLPSCITSTLLDIDRCPSCGLTTGFALIGKGQFKAAADNHPWAIPLFIMVAVIWLGALLAVVFRKWMLLIPPMILAGIMGGFYMVYWLKAMRQLI